MSKPTWIGQTIGGRYHIEETLGHGGMSAVFKGTDPNLRRTVAVKMIHSHLANDPEFVRRFEEEAAAVAQLRHPNIIQVYDFNHDGDTYYMVLEYVKGQTLESKLKELSDQGKRLPFAETMHIMQEICAAVAYAHQQGMIHRDLKPANVMIRPNGEAVLMDFGIVKIIEGNSHTATGAMMGTVAYMSPEQIRGEQPDYRTDIYSLGIMLFEMASGRRPFVGDNTASTMMMHLTEPPPDLRRFDASIPGMFSEVVQKAMAKDPNQRYQSVTEMRQALHTIANFETLEMPEQDATMMIDPNAQTIIDQTPTFAGVSTPTAVSSPKAEAKSRWPWLAAGLGLLAILVIGALFLFGGGTDETPPATATPAQLVAGAGEQTETPTATATATATSTTAATPTFTAAQAATATIAALAADNDGDGLNNGRELEMGTNPDNPDTDGDGMTDQNEVAVPCLNPLNPDTDGDGVTDNSDDDPCDIPPTPTPAERAQIVNIRLVDDIYNVTFETIGFVPSPEGSHVHFFFNTVTPEQAGVPGNGPWDIHTNPNVYARVGPKDRPADATQLCVLVAAPTHNIQPGTGNCFDLPDVITAAPTSPPPLSVRITDITIVGDAYNVVFTTTGYIPAPGEPHIHFFYNTVPPDQAGIPGEGPWDIHTNPDPYTNSRTADRPAGATEMCAQVANPDHTVRLGTGNCFPLPDVP